MKIELSQEEMYQALFTLLCEGLYYFPEYGFTLEYSEEEYKEAKKTAREKTVEGIQVQMLLNGNGLTFEDQEGGDNTAVLTLKLVEENISLIPADILAELVTGYADADMSDQALQIILYKEIIFG